MKSWGLFFVAVASTSCAPPRQGSRAARPAAEPAAAHGSPGGDATTPDAPEGTDAPRGPSDGSWLRDGRAPTPDAALPRIGIEHLGMHIGGEPNTPDHKAPLLAAIESAFDALLRCYRHVEPVLEQGSFGVDLLIASSGGAPEIRAIRQKIGNEPLVRCVSDALGQVDFPSRQRPVVVSYSFLYTVEDTH